MKIAYIVTKYKPNGGVFISLNREIEWLKKNNIEVDVFVLGRREDNYKFFNKKNPLKELFNYDIVNLFQCWGKETIGVELLSTLVSLAEKDKLIFTIHDTKSINSKSKTNYSSIINVLRNSIFLFHGEEEQNFVSSKFDLNKTVIIGHWFDMTKVKETKKNKIIVPCRIDFCKGLEFIKKYIESPYCKRKIYFHSNNINEKFVYFTGFNSILKTDLYKTNKNYLDIYKDAKILLNFTWWGKGSGGRPELTVMEGWNYNVIPILDSRWVKETGILKNEYNCLSVERNNLTQLHSIIERVFNTPKLCKSLIEGGHQTLNVLGANKYRLINFYNALKTKNYSRFIEKKGLLNGLF